MNTSNSILVIDTNVIIHFEKAGLLDVLVSDKSIRIVDLVFHQEYEHKKNNYSEKVSKIKQISLNESQVKEALEEHYNNKKISFFDYCNYIVARDNSFSLLTGDNLLKKISEINVKTYGAIWYVQQLYINNKISKEALINALNVWLKDPSVYMPEKILLDLIEDLAN